MSTSKRKQFRTQLRSDMVKHANDILTSKNFRSSARNIQHGTVSVMKHSMKVAYTSLWLSRKLRIKCEEKDLVRGALLHDYFLYDWHDEEHCGLRNLHGFYHPGVALKNASKEYDLTAREEDIIKKHMWPLTVVPPLCREAWLVTAADKYVSTVETIAKRSKKKRGDKEKTR
ncbi:MAG: phosphohydrolase [Lachnospiraceae bacterium]|nr:phosphohydrolase [Lachnospiraceae bacterium]